MGAGQYLDALKDFAVSGRSRTMKRYEKFHER